MPKATPAAKISTISGSATTHASLSRPSAFQLSVIFACSAFMSAKVLLCAIPKPPECHSQCGRNRPVGPQDERTGLFNRYRVQTENLTGSRPRLRLVIQRGENPLLQNGSKVRFYFAKHQARTRGLNIED